MVEAGGGAILAAIFQKFDANGDGLIDREELGTVMRRLNPELFGASSNLEALLDDIDHDQDGKLSYQEFSQWIEGDGDTPREVREHVQEELKQTRRKPCKYGAGCCRRKPEHRAALCHPGDWDWGFDEKLAEIIKEGEEPSTNVQDVGPTPADELTPPGYWKHKTLAEEFEEWVSVPEEVFAAAQSLITSTFREIKTRDRTSGDVPKGMEVVAMHRIEHSALWKRYATFRYQSMAKRSHRCTPVAKIVGEALKTNGASGPLDGRLRERANEAYLWHGTSPKGATGIAGSGFDLGRAGTGAGSMYGNGIYLAECSSKSDEYAQDDEAGPYKGVFCLLLCRAVLGEVLHMTAGGTATHPIIQAAIQSCAYNSVLGDREASVGTYREFVCYAEGQVYPEYVILYKRDFEGKIKLSPGEPTLPEPPRLDVPSGGGFRDPNEQMTDWFNSEPLGWAASFGELRTVQTLILAGADPLRPCNLAGCTPLSDAQREHHTAVVRFLTEYERRRKSGNNDCNVNGPLADGSVVKLLLRSHKGKTLVPKFHGRHGTRDNAGGGRIWILWTLELGDASKAVELILEGPPEQCRLRWRQENVCLEVNCRKMEEGNMIFLWNDDPPVPAGHHSTFALNDDGSISPHRTCPGANSGDPTRFALGLNGSTCVLVGRDSPRRLIFDLNGGGGSGGCGDGSLSDWVRSYDAEEGFGPRADQKQAYGWFTSQGWKEKWPLHYAAMIGDVAEIQKLTGLRQGVQASGRAKPKRGPAGHYFTFKTGTRPSQVVDRFEVRVSDGRWTHYRNGPVGSKDRVNPATAKKMESYSFHGNRLKGPVTGTLEQNGDVVWSHGYTSRREA